MNCTKFIFISLLGQVFLHSLAQQEENLVEEAEEGEDKLLLVQVVSFYFLHHECCEKPKTRRFGAMATARQSQFIPLIRTVRTSGPLDGAN